MAKERYKCWPRLNMRIDAPYYYNALRVCQYRDSLLSSAAHRQNELDGVWLSAIRPPPRQRQLTSWPPSALLVSINVKDFAAFLFPRSCPECELHESSECSSELHSHWEYLAKAAARQQDSTCNVALWAQSHIRLEWLHHRVSIFSYQQLLQISRIEPPAYVSSAANACDVGRRPPGLSSPLMSP